MTANPLRRRASRVKEAARELQDMISARYPDATFCLIRAADDPHAYHLVTAVDIDDPDEVGDLVLDRVIELQVEEAVPLHVIPVRHRGRQGASVQAPAGEAPRSQT